MRRTESCKFGHLGGTRIDQSAKAVETASYKQVQAKGTLAVAVRVTALQRTEGQAEGFGEKVVRPEAPVVSVKQRVAATSLETVISDLASKVSRSGSVA